MGDEGFFRDLPPLSSFSDVPDPDSYRQAPDSWCLVITDVVGSTRAIEEGRYKEVNALGVGSIVAVRNAVDDVELPFVFGGDGATLLCPASRIDRLRPALRGLQQRAKTAYGLAMRAGIVPIAELRQSGHPVLVLRYQQSEHAVFAMFAGSGVSEGELWIKDPQRGARYAVGEGDASADMTGFECRWKPIPARGDAIIAVVIHALASDRTEAAAIYKQAIATIETTLDGDGHPVAVQTLDLASDARLFDAEARLRSGRSDGLPSWLRRTRTGVETRVGRALLARSWNALGFPGKHYREQVVANTDFRKFDDTLRMVVDVTRSQESAIVAYLETQHAAGKLVYGVHAAPAALMTCAITEYEGNHLHFVDAADGGYALAAKQLKAQLDDL